MATKNEIKKNQCLLFYLGYYVGEVDGIWEQMSKTAVKSFKGDFGGLTVNDTVDDATVKAMKHAVAYGMPVKKQEATESKDFWKDIKYFKKSEFACKCKKYCNGTPVEPDEQLVKLLENIRKHFGVPVTVNSGVRCKTHNANVGGESNSQHLYGTAADIAVKGVTPAKVAAYVETLLPNTGGIGIYSWGVHVDVRKTKSRWNG